jgi:large subunit ribosomal protein L30
MDNILGKKIRVTQIRSRSKLTKNQKSNLSGLGLKKIGSEVNFICSEEKMGMINKVLHLINIKLV